MKRVYLDYAAGLYNPSSIHREGIEAKKDLDLARKSIATILNCRSEEIYFMPNSTYSIATAIAASANGGCIITSNIEHSAVLGNLKNYKNIILPVESDGILKPDVLRQALRNIILPVGGISRVGICGRTLVTIMYANNEIGTIQRSKEYGRIIDQYNRDNGLDLDNKVLYHIDASQASRYLDLDTYKLRCDMLTLNSSKCGGPTGIAILYIKENIRSHIRPLIYGGNQERGMYSGTENVAGAIDFAKALAYTQSIKVEESTRLTNIRNKFINEYTVAISKQIEDKDSSMHTMNLIYGSIKDGERLPNNINIRVPDIPSDEMVIRLDNLGFAVSHRSACSAVNYQIVNNDKHSEVNNEDGYVLRAISATDKESNENIRITMGPDTTEMDMDNLLEAILEIHQKYSK